MILLDLNTKIFYVEKKENSGFFAIIICLFVVEFREYPIFPPPLSSALSSSGSCSAQYRRTGPRLQISSGHQRGRQLNPTLCEYRQTEQQEW